MEIISEKTDDEDSGNDEPTDLVLDIRSQRNQRGEALPEFMNMVGWNPDDVDNGAGDHSNSDVEPEYEYD